MIQISLDEFSGKTVIGEISNIEGEVILTNTINKEMAIYLASVPYELYILKLLVDSEMIVFKVSNE